MKEPKAVKPVDLLSLLFLAFLTGLVFLFRLRIPNWAALSLRHLLLMGGYAGVIAVHRRRGSAALPPLQHLHAFFPVVVILLVFDSLSFVHDLNPHDQDELLIRIDLFLFGVHPTVRLERIASPLLTDLMILAYCSYYVLPLVFVGVLYGKGKKREFDEAAFSIVLTFYLSYIGYMLIPALGPRFALAPLHNEGLKGLILADPIMRALDFLEGVKRDAFPSGHSAVVLVVLAYAYRYEKGLYWLFLPIVLALLFSTVYMRYHYVVDVLAGMLLAALCLALSPRLFSLLLQRSPGPLPQGAP